MSEREYIICWFSIQKEKTHKNYTEQAGGGGGGGAAAAATRAGGIRTDLVL